MIIRRAGRADADALAAFAARSFRETCGPLPTAAQAEESVAENVTSERLAALATDPAGALLLAEIDGALAGYAHLRVAAPPGAVAVGAAMEIAAFFIDAPWRGRGTGAALLTACFDHARSAACDGIWLAVDEGDERAIGFCRKHAFERAGTVRLPLGRSGRPAQLLTHALLPPLPRTQAPRVRAIARYLRARVRPHPAVPVTHRVVTECLLARGRLSAGEVKRIRVLRSLPTGSSGLYRLGVRYSIGTPAYAPRSLICKVYEGDLYHATGKAELRYYTELAPQMVGPPSPFLYGSVHEPAQARVVLLLEDLEPHYRRLFGPPRSDQLAQAVDELARLHAAWWSQPRLCEPDFDVPQENLTRFGQALPPQVVRRRAAEEAAVLVANFIARFHGRLSRTDIGLLEQLALGWGERFAERIAAGALTLSHGDYHLFGNVFFPKLPGEARLRVIDWGSNRRGLGPYDLAYCLIIADIEPRLRRERDRLMLGRYYDRLMRDGAPGYDQEQCEWDYRFSLLANVFVGILNGNVDWLERTLLAAHAWDAADTLA